MPLGSRVEGVQWEERGREAGRQTGGGGLWKGSWCTPPPAGRRTGVSRSPQERLVSPEARVWASDPAGPTNRVRTSSPADPVPPALSTGAGRAQARRRAGMSARPLHRLPPSSFPRCEGRGCCLSLSKGNSLNRGVKESFLRGKSQSESWALHQIPALEPSWGADPAPPPAPPSSRKRSSSCH